MDNLKSDNISHYLKIMKDLIAGKELTIKSKLVCLGVIMNE